MVRFHVTSERKCMHVTSALFLHENFVSNDHNFDNMLLKRYILDDEVTSDLPFFLSCECTECKVFDSYSFIRNSRKTILLLYVTCYILLIYRHYMCDGICIFNIFLNLIIGTSMND